MKRGKAQITCIFNDRQARKIMNLADKTGSLSSAVRQFVDRGIGEMKRVQNDDIVIPKFLHLKASAKDAKGE